MKERFDRFVFTIKRQGVADHLYAEAYWGHYVLVFRYNVGPIIDWLQSLKQFFINVSYHVLVASLTLMALF